MNTRTEFLSADFIDPADESGRVVPVITADPHGNFCTWNCVVAHILATNSQEQTWDLIEAVKVIESLFSGQKKFQILPSPPRTERREFCGDGGLTHAEYRDAITRLRNQPITPSDHMPRTWPPRQHQPRVI